MTEDEVVVNDRRKLDRETGDPIPQVEAAQTGTVTAPSTGSAPSQDRVEFAPGELGLVIRMTKTGECAFHSNVPLDNPDTMLLLANLAINTAGALNDGVRRGLAAAREQALQQQSMSALSKSPELYRA